MGLLTHHTATREPRGGEVDARVQRRLIDTGFGSLFGSQAQETPRERPDTEGGDLA